MSKHPNIAKVREYLIESGYPEDGDALLSLAAVEAELESKATIESALTKAEAVAWEIRGKAGKPWLRCTEEVYHDHVRRVGQEHARALYAHAPPAVPVESVRKPLSETMYRGPAHPDGHREQFLDRRCLAADNVPTESLGRDAPDPVPLNAVRAALEAVDTGRTQIARDNLRILEIHLRAQVGKPPASVPDGYPLSASEARALIDQHEWWIAEAESIGAEYSGNERKLELLRAIATNQEGSAP